MLRLSALVSPHRLHSGAQLQLRVTSTLHHHGQSKCTQVRSPTARTSFTPPPRPVKVHPSTLSYSAYFIHSTTTASQSAPKYALLQRVLHSLHHHGQSKCTQVRSPTARTSFTPPPRPVKVHPSTLSYSAYFIHSTTTASQSAPKYALLQRVLHSLHHHGQSKCTQVRSPTARTSFTPPPRPVKVHPSTLSYSAYFIHSTTTASQSAPKYAILQRLLH